MPHTELEGFILGWKQENLRNPDELGDTFRRRNQSAVAGFGAMFSHVQLLGNPEFRRMSSSLTHLHTLPHFDD